MPTLARWLFPVAALICLVPGVPAALALIAGIALALALGNPYLARTRKLTTPLLQLAVVGLGAGMNLERVMVAGLKGFGYTAASIALCLSIGVVLLRVLKVERDAGTLITAGTAICGGSAIAALIPVIRPKEHEASVALATVFLLNAVALIAFPPLGRALALSQPSFGVWAALAIHDTSSVVGAGMQYGAQALEIATTIKLARALWIVPLTLAVGALWQRRFHQPPAAGEAPRKRTRPWFILGFVAAAAVVTWVPALQPAGELVARGARQALVLTLFLIGSGLTREAIRKVGVRPLAMGVLLWLAMGSLSLGAVVGGILPAP